MVTLRVVSVGTGLHFVLGHELVGPVAPGEDLGQELVHVQGEGVLDLVGGQEAELDEDGAQPLAVAHREADRALEIGGGQPAVADQDFAHPVLAHAGVGVDDVAVPEAEAAAVGAPMEGEHAGLPSDVKLAQQARQYAFAEGSVHGHRGGAKV